MDRRDFLKGIGLFAIAPTFVHRRAPGGKLGIDYSYSNLMPGAIKLTCVDGEVFVNPLIIQNLTASCHLRNPDAFQLKIGFYKRPGHIAYCALRPGCPDDYQRNIVRFAPEAFQEEFPVLLKDMMRFQSAWWHHESLVNT